MRYALTVVLLALCGCVDVPRVTEISKAAGYAAPADFTKGVGEVKWTQSEDGRTLYWEVPYRNDGKLGCWYSIFPSITVKEYDKAKNIEGRIVWTGRDEKNWYAAPGSHGFKSGKIEIPQEAIGPTLQWERGSCPSCEWNGAAGSK